MCRVGVKEPVELSPVFALKLVARTLVIHHHFHFMIIDEASLVTIAQMRAKKTVHETLDQLGWEAAGVARLKRLVRLSRFVCNRASEDAGH